jgi:hypothetical protein
MHSFFNSLDRVLPKKNALCTAKRSYDFLGFFMLCHYCAQKIHGNNSRFTSFQLTKNLINCHLSPGPFHCVMAHDAPASCI